MATADGRGPTRSVDRDRAAQAAADKAGLEMSAASVSALFTKEPTQIKRTTLIALCTALQCTPDDLFEIDTTPVEHPAEPPIRPAPTQRKAVNARGRSLPPI